jgi:tetratricopeptide (TPR) repeat protein
MKLELTKDWKFGAGAIIVCAGAIAYLPALRAGFIWDDSEFLTANPLIKAADGLKRFWLATAAPDYWPVTSSSLWLEWRLWGAHALGYHATNLALHLCTSLLLWAVLRRLAVPGAFLAALLFAVHPVNVESVAWVTQRKNLMAMLFYLLSILWAIDWVERGPPNAPVRPRAIRYWLSLTAFILAMLSKGSVAILPVVLLGLILWRRRLEVRDAVRLAPFFLVSGALGLVNLWFAGRHLPGAIRNAGGLERLLGAGTVIGFYLSKALWPVRLMFVYPDWHIQPRELRWWAPLLAAIAVTAVFWRWRRTWGRPWLFAWGYFCVALAPVMGFTDVTFMQYSLVADHYQHLAIIAVVALIAVGWERWRAAASAAHRAWPPRLAAVVAVGGLIGLTWNQCLIYRDAETLFRATLKVNPDAWLAHNNLGLMLYDAGKIAEAREHFDAALRLNPDCVEAHNNLGMLLAKTGRDADAIAQYEEALRLRPYYAEAQNNLGSTLAGSGQLPAAIVHLSAAVRLQPDYADAHYNLGNALGNAGRLPEAIAEFERTVQLRPEDGEAENHLGVALAESGRTEEAMTHLKNGLRLHPDDGGAHYVLGLALARSGKLTEAIVQFEAAVRLDPNDAEAHDNLGVALDHVGRISEAIAHLETAVRLQPDDIEARENLRRLYGAGGHWRSP